MLILAIAWALTSLSPNPSFSTFYGTELIHGTVTVKLERAQPNTRIAWAYPETRMKYYVNGVHKRLADHIVDVAYDVGANPIDIANLMYKESGFNAEAINKTTGASGVLQMMPKTAKLLGTDIHTIRSMNPAEQLHFHTLYWEDSMVRGRIGDTWGLVAANFYPLALYRPKGWTLPGYVQDVNNGLSSVDAYLHWMRKAAKLTPWPEDRRL
jgi:hypothetical protein